jgi:hypothetical protein
MSGYLLVEELIVMLNTIYGYLDDALAKSCMAVVENLIAIVEKNKRAFKLMLEDKKFLVVSEKEDYYIKVYLMIREAEIKNNTWTYDDEHFFQIACINKTGSSWEPRWSP